MQAEFARAAATYDEVALLAREVHSRLAERLDYIRINPSRVADVGCATGDGAYELQRRYPTALPLGIDTALPMLQAVAGRAKRGNWLQRLRAKQPSCVQADAIALPLAAQSLQLVWSNLMLHWLDEPINAFKEFARVLEPGGLLTFAMLGPDTGKELRAACVEAGVTPPLRMFLDMHDVGDQLVAAGFADPVMDMEHIQFTYRSARTFLRDQRLLGVRNALLGQLPWRTWRRVLRAWEMQRNEAGLSFNFEIVYGHAWKVATKQTEEGHAIMQFHPRRKD